MTDLSDSPSVELQNARTLLTQCVLDGTVETDILELPERDQFRCLLVALKLGLAQAIEIGLSEQTLDNGLFGIRTLETAIAEVA